MICRKAKKWLPLHAGDDLSPKRARKIERHIRICPSCRKEIEGWRLALDILQSQARRSPIQDWSESDWKTLMASIAAERIEEKTNIFGLKPRSAFAVGLIALIVLAGLLFIIRKPVLRPGATIPGSGPDIVEKQIVPDSSEMAPEIPKPGRGMEFVSSERTLRKAENQLQPEKTRKPDTTAVSSSQDVIEVSLVSQESGLQIVWIFNKNFEWKGEEP